MGATILAPPRSLGQRRAALAVANAVRSDRALLKRKVISLGKIGAPLHAAALIERPPPSLESMRLTDLLLCIPQWGDVSVERLLRWLDVSPRKKIGGLSPRQRKLVVNALRKRAS